VSSSGFLNLKFILDNFFVFKEALMLQELIIKSAYIFVSAGVFCVLWSFLPPIEKYDQRKLIRIGGAGVILALVGGLIIIFLYYASQPVSDRIMKQHLEKKYIEEPSDVSMRSNLQDKYIKT
jgi:hypothetical protein